MKKKKQVAAECSVEPVIAPANDIVVRIKRESGNQDCPRDIRELMKDAVDAIKSLRERVRFLEKAESQRANRRIGASVAYEGDSAPESDLTFERPTERCRANIKLNPQDHEGIDFP